MHVSSLRSLSSRSRKKVTRPKNSHTTADRPSLRIERAPLGSRHLPDYERFRVSGIRRRRNLLLDVVAQTLRDATAGDVVGCAPDLDAIDVLCGEREPSQLSSRRCRQASPRLRERQPVSNLDRAISDAGVETAAAEHVAGRVEDAVDPLSARFESLFVAFEAFCQRLSWDATVDDPRRPCAKMCVARRENRCESRRIGRGPRAKGER